MKIIISLILATLINSIFIQSNTKVIDDSNKYTLSFIGNDKNENQLRDEYSCYFPIYINIQLDTTYKYSFPNPCSPTMINQNFIFKLTEDSDIKIKLIDSNDSIYFQTNHKKSNKGYYYFRIKNKYLTESSVTNNILNQKELYTIVFSFNNKKYVLPLSKGISKKL